jgi:hypothetical protein
LSVAYINLTAEEQNDTLVEVNATSERARFVSLTPGERGAGDSVFTESTFRNREIIVPLPDHTDFSADNFFKIPATGTGARRSLFDSGCALDLPIPPFREVRLRCVVSVAGPFPLTAYRLTPISRNFSSART